MENTALSLPKKSFRVILSNGESVVLMINKAPLWNELIESKTVVELDRKTINFSYVIMVEEISPFDNVPGTTKAWIETLPPGIKEVMEERVRSYESDGKKMTLDKARSRMEYFMRNMESEDLRKYRPIYERGLTYSRYGS